MLSRWVVGAAVMLGLMYPMADSKAAIVSFTGRAPITRGSSIPGINRHDVFYFDISIDDSQLDTDHWVESNGFGGVTATGEFSQLVTHFRLYASPYNTGSYDPKDVTYDLSTHTLVRTIDAGPGVGSSMHNEKFLFYTRVSQQSLNAGAPFSRIHLNLYNGTLHDNPSDKQLWLDTSSSGLPTTFGSFFLHGTRSLEQFRGSVPADFNNANDGIFLEGLYGSGNLAAGEGVTLEYIPEPSTSMLLAVGSLAMLALRSRRRRHRGQSVGTI